MSHDPPPIVVGGQADPVFRRAARHGDGWIMGTAPPEYFPPAVEKLEAAWRAEGRDGEPRKMSLSYFSLAPDPEAELRESIGGYYAFAGELADMLVGWAPKGQEEVRERVRVFEQVGCDELIMCPVSSDPDDVDRLAAAVL